MSLLNERDAICATADSMRPRRAVPQTPQASFASIPVTILQTHDSSNPFNSNTYKAPSQVLILNPLRRQLNPLDATLTQKLGGGARLVSHWSCLAVEIVTSHLSPSPLLSTSCTLFGPTEASRFLCYQSLPHSFRRDGGGGPSLFLTSLPPYFLTSRTSAAPSDFE